jgi:hypothetical protein
MREFKLDEHVSVICDWKKTRIAFKHEATLLIDGHERDKTKICYQNRTWESYEYQSVLIKLLNDTKELLPEQKALFIAYAEKDHTDWSGLNAIARVCAIGEILCDNQKDKNDWKTRMIKAGLGESIQVPEDLESLTEEERESRLNQCIEVLKDAGKSL